MRPVDEAYPNESGLPRELFELIVRLAGRHDVRSISCPLTDFRLWRELISVQVKRAEALGVAPAIALVLSGPDSGIPMVRTGVLENDRLWGGEVHIPYEGALDADLFIQPEWHSSFPALGCANSTLSQIVFGEDFGHRSCKYLLTQSVRFRGLNQLTSREVGGWTLYSTGPLPD